MTIIRKSIILLFCFILAFCPLMTFSHFSYAEYENDGWAYTSTREEKVAAVKAYFAARNFFSKVNPVKAYITWEYNTINDACLYLYGQSLDDIGANMKYRYNSSSFLQFWLDDNIIAKLNGVYTHLLQKYGLQENEQKTVWSGEYFEDLDGYHCMVWYINANNTRVSAAQFNTDVTKVGTSYRFEGIPYYESHNAGSTTYTINFKDSQDNSISLNYNINVTKNSQNDYVCLRPEGYSSTGQDYAFYWTRPEYVHSPDVNTKYGCMLVCKNENTGKYYLGTYLHQGIEDDNTSNFYSYRKIIELTPPETDNSNVQAKQGSNTNPFQSGKDAVISAGKDAIPDFIEDDEDTVTVEPFDPENDPVPDPDPPSGGSGGNGPTFSLPIIGGAINADGTFNFHMPDTNSFAPNGFTISGLLQKFPFCVPLDMYAILDLLDAQPVTPRFQTDVEFPTFTYHLDINCSMFDDTMVYVRKLFLILYIFGIIYITPYIVK